jgi:hypothetical protein
LLARAHPDVLLRLGGHCLLPLPLGTAVLPNIACVHGIILTADGYLLLAQRTSGASYAPNSWSASFEEQLTTVDLRDLAQPFHRAAQRGALEEFGCEVDLARIHLVTVILELEILNLALVAILETEQPLEQIRRRWQTSPRPSHATEIADIDGVRASPESLKELAASKEYRDNPLHPTSDLRADLLARWLRNGLSANLCFVCAASVASWLSPRSATATST